MAYGATGRGSGRVRLPSRAGIALAVVVLAAGCDPIGPDFTRPQTAVIEKWAEANSSASGGAGGLTARSEPVVQWWDTFNDPVLSDLVRRAYAQNLSLQVAGARVLQARAQLGVAFGEQFPQVQTVGASRTRERVSESVGLARDVGRVIDVDPTVSANKVGFDAQWELDVWGNQRRLVQSAEANLAAKIADYDDALVTLTGDVAATYISIRAIEAGLAIARKNIELQQQSADLTELRFKNGVTTDLDVQESLALLNSTKALVPALESDLREAQNALAVLLGQTPGSVPPLIARSRGIPAPRGTVAVGIPNELLRRRPDVRAAEMEAAAQSAQIGVALGDLYPQFGLSGAIGYLAPVGGDLVSASSRTTLASGGVIWNIFNYGRIQNNVRAQDAAFQELVARYQNTVLAAYGEVDGAMVAYRKAREEAALLSESANAARKAAEIAVQQYADGIADYSRVLNTQTALLRTEANLVDARAAVATNLVSLYKGLGGGWQIRQNREFLPETVLAEMAYRTDWGDLLQSTPAKAGLP